MATPHVIASSSGHHSQSATSNGVVGNHFRVGKKIGEGSFGVVFEGATYCNRVCGWLLNSVIAGTNMLNNQPVAIKFVCDAMSLAEPLSAVFDRDNVCRNPASLKPHSCETSTGRIGR